jgi:hypothetical protein
MLVTKGQSGPFQLHSTIDIPQAHPINFENEDDEDEEEIKPF